MFSFFRKYLPSTIRIPKVDIILPAKFNIEAMSSAMDNHGNRLIVKGQKIVFRPGSVTNQRKLNDFIQRHIAPYINFQGEEGTIRAVVNNCYENATRQYRSVVFTFTPSKRKPAVKIK